MRQKKKLRGSEKRKWRRGKRKKRIEINWKRGEEKEIKRRGEIKIGGGQEEED